jgi:hypothetical protein
MDADYPSAAEASRTITRPRPSSGNDMKMATRNAFKIAGASSPWRFSHEVPQQEKSH